MNVAMPDMNRRYDIDWIRVIAIGLLMIYHVAIGFQPWGTMIGFIVSKNSWESLWTPMSLINTWRIPLLFFVSGMGVFFALQNRNLKQLLAERALRIFVPFVFGMFCLVPLHVWLRNQYYHWDLVYAWDPGHLWFLGNISVYVLILSPLFYGMIRHRKSKLVNAIRRVLSTPAGLLVVILAFVAEAEGLNPRPFELYAMTLHGFLLGLLAFFFGFCFMLSGEGFTKMMVRWRWVFLSLVLLMFLIRLNITGVNTPAYRMAIESCMGVFTVLAFGFRYLNHGNKALRYLSEAAYPVYILHMIFLYLGSYLFFPMTIPAGLQFLLVLVFTLGGCLLTYEGIRRVTLLRPLFGLKVKRRTEPVAAATSQAM